MTPRHSMTNCQSGSRQCTDLLAHGRGKEEEPYERLCSETRPAHLPVRPIRKGCECGGHRPQIIQPILSIHALPPHVSMHWDPQALSHATRADPLVGESVQKDQIARFVTRFVHPRTYDTKTATSCSSNDLPCFPSDEYSSSQPT